MSLTAQFCAFITYGGKQIPHAGAIASILTFLGVLLTFIIRALPIEAELVPILGAFLGGFEFKNHTISSVVIIYLLVSIAVVTGLILIC